MSDTCVVLRDLLPRNVAIFETREDLLPVGLFPEEERSLGDVGEKRRAEFVTGRACARRALEMLGLPRHAIRVGAQREPRWPDGVVGSITHCPGYRACAAAFSDAVAAVGIDAEPHAAVPELVWEAITTPLERRLLRLTGDVRLDKVLFCAKEAIYKACFPLTGQWLSFEDVELALSPSDSVFVGRLAGPGPAVRGRRLTELHGRWQVDDDLVVAAVVIA